ncbi:MAG: GNAT family N-acetyltransferase [Luteolibacter sp.]
MDEPVKHLGLQTNLFFIEDDGIIKEYPDYTSVESPLRPTFYGGNFLLLSRAPKNTERERLEKLFSSSFAHNPRIKHITFKWNSNDHEDHSSFLEAGYIFNEETVLVASKGDLVRPNSVNTNIEIRPFASEGDWNAWIQMEVDGRENGHSEESYRFFIGNQAASYRKLTRRGMGHFYGAWLDGHLAATMGLYFKNGIGRCQAVHTRSEFRRQHICKSLVYHVCQTGLQYLDKIVIVADKHYHALDIYKSLGFRYKEQQSDLCLYPDKRTDQSS